MSDAKTQTTLPEEITDILCSDIDLEEAENNMRKDVARSIVIFLTMVGPHYGSKLYRHLENSGDPFPKWLFDLIPNKDHTPPMACFAIAIAKLYGAEIND